MSWNRQSTRSSNITDQLIKEFGMAQKKDSGAKKAMTTQQIVMGFIAVIVILSMVFSLFAR